MDGRGGCCIARYDGGGTYDTSKIDRIMLRFRPIAPKPAVSRSVSGETTPEKTDNFIRTGRAKRRYVKDTNNNSSSKRCCRKRKVAPAEEEKKETVVTLSLLPEQPDRKEESPTMRVGGYSPSDHQVDLTAPIWSKYSDINRGQTSSPESSGGWSSDRTTTTTTVVMPQPVRPVGSCVVVVGCATETYMDGEELGLGGLGSTDEEKRSNLEMDTCPGFISDGLNRVRWTNEAYTRLVNQQDGVVVGGGGADFLDQEGIRKRRAEMVWLVMKEEAGGLMMRMRCKAFACRVRLQYTCRKERNSLIVPCDVWKMDGGGYAWRLDVKAALSLGR